MKQKNNLFLWERNFSQSSILRVAYFLKNVHNLIFQKKIYDLFFSTKKLQKIFFLKILKGIFLLNYCLNFLIKLQKFFKDLSYKEKIFFCYKESKTKKKKIQINKISLEIKSFTLTLFFYFFIIKDNNITKNFPFFFLNIFWLSNQNNLIHL